MKRDIVLDLDDTVFMTEHKLMRIGIELFGLSEEDERLGVDGMMAKYGRSWKVPYFQDNDDPYFNKWLVAAVEDGSFYEDLSLVPKVLESLERLEPVARVVGYNSARPERFLDVSMASLRRNGLPEGFVMHRPESVSWSDARRHKADWLAGSYPAIHGLVDDNAGVASHLPGDYQGHFFAIHNRRNGQGLPSFVHFCDDWPAVVEKAYEVFSPDD